MFDEIENFRARLRNGDFLLGTGITLADPAVTEALGPSVDFFWIDLEHNPLSLESVLAHLIAARAVKVPALVRVPMPDVGWVKRVLDTGAVGIIVPQVSSLAQVQEMVDACRYPPMGKRGYGPRRPSNYGRNGGSDYLQQANSKVFLAAQIETAEALAEVESIAKLPGLDSLVLGPNDLAGSLGFAGQPQHPEVAKAMDRVTKAAKSAGKSLGAGMGNDPAFAKSLRKLGVNWIQVGSDFSYLTAMADSLLGAARSAAASG